MQSTGYPLRSSSFTAGAAPAGTTAAVQRGPRRRSRLHFRLPLAACFSLVFGVEPLVRSRMRSSLRAPLVSGRGDAPGAADAPDAGSGRPDWSLDWSLTSRPRERSTTPTTCLRMSSRRPPPSRSVPHHLAASPDVPPAFRRLPEAPVAQWEPQRGVGASITSPGSASPLRQRPARCASDGRADARLQVPEPHRAPDLKEAGAAARSGARETRGPERWGCARTTPGPAGHRRR